MAQSAQDIGELVLVDRCLEGAEDAHRELYRRYQPRVYRTLYRLLGHSADVDDVLQESFIQVFRSLPGYRGDARLATWIDRIAVRVAFRHLRRQVPTEELPDDLAQRRSLPSTQVDSREGVRRLYEVLSTLSPAARIAFVLHEVEGRSVSEVAEIIGAAYSATKLRIWRARKSLEKAARLDPILQEFLSEEEA